MATIYETAIATEETVATREAAVHNARIKERYHQLLNAEATQLEESYEEARQAYASASAPVLAPERTVDPMPEQFGHTRVDSPLFTTETLERTLGGYATDIAPTQTVQTPVTTVESEVRAETYGLTRFAKLAIAAFVGVVTIMMTVIGINSNVIARKSVRVRNLEQKKERLLEENEELQARIREATSYESILEYAEESGMIYVGD
jgi:cell division protein FtsL